MTAAERARLKQAVSEARRVKTGSSGCPNGWGSEHGYNYRCRCAACTLAAKEGRRSRRLRAQERAAA